MMGVEWLLGAVAHHRNPLATSSRAVSPHGSLRASDVISLLSRRSSMASQMMNLRLKAVINKMILMMRVVNTWPRPTDEEGVELTTSASVAAAVGKTSRCRDCCMAKLILMRMGILCLSVVPQ